jgi:drug/metabolite transporter (DMT)-like permease
MPWYDYLACFFAGAFLANVVPHFVHGISGDPFPTPFAKPPGRGLSSPTVNVLWALLNLILGYVLFRAGRVSMQNVISILVFFAGVAFLSVGSSIGFQKKHPR